MSPPVRPLRVPRGTRRKLDAYAAQHVDTYQAMAKRIDPGPDPSDDRVFARVGFAILSANTTFDQATKALAYCHGANWRPDPFILATMGQVPAKAEYIRDMANPSIDYLMGPDETWHAYRERLASSTKGLGRAKASFAACLLYPQAADLACLDTWMVKLLYGVSGFIDLSRRDYLHGERWVRRFARRWGVSTFIAQWIIWDHQRTGEPNGHNIFPGRHKDGG